MTLLFKRVTAGFAAAFALAASAMGQTNSEVDAGPLYARFPLTLTSGYRTEAAGPLYYSQESGAQEQWGLPPLFSHTRTPDVDWTEWEFLYPVVDYRRFGPEYRLQFIELLSFSGGREPSEGTTTNTTVFPFFFRHREADTNNNYTAVAPFYGHLVNRLLRDDIRFFMFPLYSRTRKKDVVTDNYVYPIFDTRHGDHLRGWQIWPLIGVEHKTPFMTTNSWGDTLTNGGHDSLFALWPFYYQGKNGIGTTNESTTRYLVPFYEHDKSAAREHRSYGWPLGYNVAHDRENHYDEHDLLWPIIVQARGDKYVNRVLPLYSRARNKDLESDDYLWPVYKYNRLLAPPLERRRARVLFFLYSDTRETNSDTGQWVRRADFWPFYTYHREADGSERWQALAVLEPFFPNNRSIPREYSPVWSLWRCEKNAKTKAKSQSLLWNLYHRESAPGSKKFSLFFGLYQYQSDADGRRWKLCHVSIARKPPRLDAPKS